MKITQVLSVITNRRKGDKGIYNLKKVGMMVKKKLIRSGILRTEINQWYSLFLWSVWTCSSALMYLYTGHNWIEAVIASGVHQGAGLNALLLYVTGNFQQGSQLSIQTHRLSHKLLINETLSSSSIDFYARCDP